MKLQITTKVVGFLSLVLVVVVTAWFTGFAEKILPSPQRVRLAANNAISAGNWPTERRFRLVLCWLDDDYSGESTKKVAQALAGIDGIDVARSAWIVSAQGAGDTWRSAMREQTHRILESWQGDLAIVGLVKVPQQALTLWVIPRVGDDTLIRGDRPYELKLGTLPPAFHDDIQLQLIALAFNAVTAEGDIEAARPVISNTLQAVADQVDNLLKNRTFSDSWLRDELRFSLGHALLQLGEREIGADRLERAVDVYRELVEGAGPKQAKGNWARAHMHLGIALAALGERTKDAGLVHQAIRSYESALEVRSREHQPLDWARTRTNLANALLRLGMWEQDSKRIEAAIAAYQAVLEIYTRSVMT